MAEYEWVKQYNEWLWQQDGETWASLWSSDGVWRLVYVRGCGLMAADLREIARKLDSLNGEYAP